MNSTEEGEGAILQLKQENARHRELHGRRSQEIELKMGELRAALHQANEKYKELESVVGESRSLVSDSGLPGKEPEEQSGAQVNRDLPLACAKCNELEKEVKDIRSILSNAGLGKEGPLKELTVQGPAAGRGQASLSTGETSKRPSENSGEEPPRKMRPVPAKASGEDVSRPDADGMTPLHEAAEDGDAQRVRELLARGADTRFRDRKGRTPIHSALIESKEEAADLLADADSGNDIEDLQGLTPLYWAARRGYVETARKLLAGGARTRVGFRQTPLHCALQNRREAAAELIAGVDGSIDNQDIFGRSPLHYAVALGFVEVVKTLLQNDVNPHTRDNKGQCPIQLAVTWRRRDDIWKMILSSYALKDIVINWGRLKLKPRHLQLCLRELSLCSEEIRLMKNARVGASSLSYHDLVTRHVSRTAPRLPGECVRDVVRRDRRERDFPHYADLISVRLRSAEEWRVSLDQCRQCFSLLPPALTPLPVTCTDIVLLCLSRRDMENFIRAVQCPSRE